MLKPSLGEAFFVLIKLITKNKEPAFQWEMPPYGKIK